MLDTLHIENIAVIEKADIDFAPGLNVLTGETFGKTDVIRMQLEEKSAAVLVRMDDVDA